MGGGRLTQQNSYYPSPEMHFDAAEALLPVAKELLTAKSIESAYPGYPLISSDNVHSELNLPNFIIIGSAKCGTSAVADQISGHPEIYIPPIKEVHFFDRVYKASATKEDQRKHLQAYSAMYAGGRNRKRRGDATVAYSMYPVISHVPRAIKETLGDVKLIYIVRDPLARIVSHFRHAVRDGEDADFNDWITSRFAWDYSICRSDYSLQMQLYEDVFGPDSVYVCFYEDFCSNREAFLSNLFCYLEVESSFAKRIPNSIVNQTRDSIPYPEVSQSSIKFIQDSLGVQSRRFLLNHQKQIDFWPSVRA
jgi:hypothetical protein